MDTVVSETFVGMANGLPRTAFGQGSQPIDFNNDGLVDFIILNTGGNDTGTPQGYVLVINKGNWQFEVLEDALLSSVGGLSSNTGGGNFNEDTPYGSLVTGDYDKDGFTDVLLCGNGPSGRYTMLLRNVNGDHFEEAKVLIHCHLTKSLPRWGFLRKPMAGWIRKQVCLSPENIQRYRQCGRNKCLTVRWCSLIWMETVGWIL